MKTLRHLNRKVLYLGLTGAQLGTAFVAILWAALVSAPAGIAAGLAAAAAAAVINRKINGGSADPVREWLIKKKSPKKLEDTHKALKYL